MIRAGIPGLPPRKAGEYLTDREADEGHVRLIVPVAHQPAGQNDQDRRQQQRDKGDGADGAGGGGEDPEKDPPVGLTFGIHPVNNKPRTKIPKSFFMLKFYTKFLDTHMT